jgi:hypothetical protein
MFKTIATTGLAVSLAFGAAGGIASADERSANLDLTTALNAQIESEETVSKAEFMTMAKANSWTMEDLEEFAEVNGMTETELQAWFESNGWSERDSASLDLDLGADLELSSILEENDEDDDDGLLDDLLGDLL